MADKREGNSIHDSVEATEIFISDEGTQTRCNVCPKGVDLIGVSKSRIMYGSKGNLQRVNAVDVCCPWPKAPEVPYHPPAPVRDPAGLLLWIKLTTGDRTWLVSMIDRGAK